ncbi:XrtA/PEP-CTERM system-associated ATPase [Erythrobacter sp. HL-111]|uniref:XrtA/PEP-CTERM system-associated ATPase n=1 Tax=Erythrobacter sp. HL-111 TaxID=1798193 RepID=UPI0006DA9982|nr:XrtA/PEP-CTERM system-associated ATPase [Erythrobacter sp. HL-111]KPP96584.1 MAG: Type II secretory pathway, component ExeA (predicted ATPase) [Erythrobacteraceae bacterium HL-111]SDS02883.1 putative secretion ATPase, PEP-CTERM locus subfamily [Erythrobacter sp. HL-111]
MYEQFYGLTARPFQLTPDPEFWFESTTHRKAMSYLGYGLNQGEGFIVVTGEVGAGKSTLVAHLMERIDREALTVAQVVTSSLDGEELVHVVAQAFGLSVEGHDKAGALGAIERFLQDEARAGRRCLLVVDECQNLTLDALEELRMLSNFQLGSHPLLQGLLLGQPEFRRTLAHHPGLDQLRQRIIASHHLEALGEREVEAYVAHRLSRVGWKDRPIFAEGLLGALYLATEGIPRRINQVMNRLLLLGAIEEAEELTPAMLDAVIEEMAGDEARGATGTPGPVQAPALVEEEAAGPTPADAVPAGEVAALLAERDARTAELEAAISELQAAGRLSQGELDAVRGAEDPDLAEAIRRIEARLEEQEQSLRHVLTMLIEWLEGDGAREAA